MKRIARVLLPVVLISFILNGCGGGVSEDKPISEVKTEAQAMSVDQLKATVAKYRAAIESKKAEIVKIKEQLKKIPIADMLGEEAKKLKGDVQNITKSIRALTDRLNTYARELRNKT